MSKGLGLQMLHSEWAKADAEAHAWKGLRGETCPTCMHLCAYSLMIRKRAVPLTR